MRNLPNLFNKYLHNEKGLIHIVIIIVILLALALGVYLVQTRTNINPFAQFVSGPISGPTADTDKDGFSDSQESFMGTSPTNACPTSLSDNAWPVDVNNDKNINGGDVSTLVPYISGAKQYSRRYDLNQDNKIDQADVTVIQVNFLKSCEVVEKTAVIRIAPMNQTVAIGDTVSLGVYVSIPGEAANLVSAQINYPADKLDFVSMTVDTPGAEGFNTTVEQFAGNGTISIIKGSTVGVSTGSVNSGVTIGKLQFKAKSSGTAAVTLNKLTSEVLRVGDGANILNTVNSLDANIQINTAATPQPTPVGQACNPRPNINRITTMTPYGLKVTVSPGTNSATPQNTISSISFTNFTNGKVTINNQTQSNPFVYQNSANASEITFWINQISFGQSTTVEMRVKDTCGDYPLFFGGGTGAGWPSVIMTPPPVVTPAPTIAPTPVATPTTVACTLTKAEWVQTGQVQSNTTAELRVEATGNCTNKMVNFLIWEDDVVYGDNTLVKPQPVFLVNTSQPNTYAATAIWITEFQEDGPFGTSYPPEYKFVATLENNPDGSTPYANSTNFLEVLRTAGMPSPVKGDVNLDGKANLRDISWLLANWNKKTGDDILDIRPDGFINTFDMAELTNILKQQGVLKTLP